MTAIIDARAILTSVHRESRVLYYKTRCPVPAPRLSLRQTMTREGAQARLRYWCARRPAAAAAARRGLALYQLDMACFAAGRRGREVRRVHGNPHDPSYDVILIMIVPVIAMAIAPERDIARGLLVGSVKG
jgi:hypothetical protein